MRVSLHRTVFSTVTAYALRRLDSSWRKVNSRRGLRYRRFVVSLNSLEYYSPTLGKVSNEFKETTNR